jgi:hypothetical protein
MVTVDDMNPYQTEVCFCSDVVQEGFIVYNDTACIKEILEFLQVLPLLAVDNVRHVAKEQAGLEKSIADYKSKTVRS